MNAGLLNPPAVALLEQVVQFAQRRHTVLAGNIANLDTPGYEVRDLSVEDFQARLREALAAIKQTPRSSGGGTPAADALRELMAHSPGWAAAAGPGAAAAGPGAAAAGPGAVAAESSPAEMLAQVSRHPKTILRHDLDNVGLEYQVTEMVKNQVQHNLALALLVKQFHLLETAISGRV